jgi:hypothetical protein
MAANNKPTAEVLAGLVERVTFHALDEGHCGLPRDDLLPLAVKLLEIPDAIVLDALRLELDAGRVIADIIASGAVPVGTLTEVFRQAALSQIVQSAHRINSGQMPNLSAPRDAADFYLVEASGPDIAITRLIDLVKERIPRRFGLDPIRDIQVLCPMNRGGPGARSLNIELQRALNPRGEPKVTTSSLLRRRRSINRKARNFPLSSFPSRQYDAATQSALHRCGKRLVILLGQKKAVAIAVKNVSGRRRWSKLREWLNPV